MCIFYKTSTTLLAPPSFIKFSGAFFEFLINSHLSSPPLFLRLNEKVTNASYINIDIVPIK